jgi:hypothetical protein
MGMGSSCARTPPAARASSPAGELAAAWRCGAAAPPSSAADCFGRLVYLRSGTDLATVSLVDERRKCCFVADGASWVQCLKEKLGAGEILMRNGVEPAWFEAELAKGTRFRLVLLDSDDTIWAADWDGVQRAVETYHPRAAEKMRTHWPALRSLSWAQLEEQQQMATPGESFATLEARDGPMTEDVYVGGVASDDTPARARRFLVSTLSLNRLFAGTGYTVDEREAGARGTAEFFAANRRLSNVPPEQVVEIEC